MLPNMSSYVISLRVFCDSDLVVLVKFCNKEHVYICLALNYTADTKHFGIDYGNFL